MTINIAFVADPHLCTISKRRNIFSLLKRELWKSLDTIKETFGDFGSNPEHVFIPSSFDDRPLLAAADFISFVSDDLDLLVLLGDLATTGMTQDLSIAHQTFVDESVKTHLSHSIVPTFGGLQIPLHVIPGNHDRYQDNKATPGGRNFDTVFEKVYKPTKGVSVDTLSKGDVIVGLISADFCFPEDSSIHFYRKYGRGKVDQVVLSELEFQTRTWKENNPDKPVIWALHFSPDDNVKRDLQLEEREKVIRLAEKLRIKHIFCGHTHIKLRTIGTHPHIYCAGSVSAIDSRNNHFLHICTIDFDGTEYQLEVHDFKYSEKKDEFLLEPISSIA